ncbi:MULTISPECIES: 50S ribosomal protein L18e [unclassified Methanosarcina]|uniref:50S ribosomal protein L18e n=1 Tax=unclassified Methanosarcina TaxID=2644672 RepID=UPI0006161FB8|nr:MULTISPECIES: 50S ribosomal protein L18e [unclassified Methanosarcina]AKB19173.1 LSU ribosomal protein L18e [Methanosarcina sp. WWM596]AKB22998.1 LSU ribosomal protein L18e [Methanosarcina sp. WH1]
MGKKSLVKLTRKTNPRIVSLILTLKDGANVDSAPIWKDIAKRLEAPSRNYAAVNISKINRHTNEGDVLLIPGKVLGAGLLDHPVTVAALTFSESAVERITEVGGKCLSLEEIMEANPKGSGIRIFR